MAKVKGALDPEQADILSAYSTEQGKSASQKSCLSCCLLGDMALKPVFVCTFPSEHAELTMLGTGLSLGQHLLPLPMQQVCREYIVSFGVFAELQATGKQPESSYLQGSGRWTCTMQLTTCRTPQTWKS